VSRAAGALARAYRHGVRPVLATLDPPLGGRRCKYEPTCSRYAVEALGEFGLLRGTALALWRLARCNPFSHGGVDHVHAQRLFRTRPRTPRRRTA